MTERGKSSPPDALERRIFHKLLVVSNLPASWPAAFIALVVLLLIIAASGLWWLGLAIGVAPYLTIALISFVMGDALVLVNLPRWRISYGPIGPQLFVLLAPRLMVAVVAALLVPCIGALPALLGVLVINLAASAALVWGAAHEPTRVLVSCRELSTDLLMFEAKPIRLLHISDLHVERLGCREERVIELVRELNPDLIVLTGDYVNLSCVDDPVGHAHARSLLEALCEVVPSRTTAGDYRCLRKGDGPVSSASPAAPEGTSHTSVSLRERDTDVQTCVYAVLGSPPVDRNSEALFDGLPIRLLRNEVETVRLADGNRLALMGLDCSHYPEHDAQRLAQVAAQAPPDTLRVLLYHSPELMPVAAQFDVDLYLCGHTHGGQVRLPFYGALLTSSTLGKRYESGAYRDERTTLYVSRGVGLEGLSAPRVRFLCPPEIVLWSLTPPSAAHVVRPETRS